MEITVNDFKQWVKAEEGTLARSLYRFVKMLKTIQAPRMIWLYRPLLMLHHTVVSLCGNIIRIVYWAPLFQSRLEIQAKRLYLYNGMPYISGKLSISVGENCRISGQTTFSGRTTSQNPQLIVGDNVDIGWQTTIAVGRQVILGNNVRIAGQAFLAGYPGHPMDATARAQGFPDSDDQIGDIILEDDVWLATGVSVMAGMHIGKGTIVAAGSVVTHDLPAGVLAGGVPARVIRELER